MRDEIGITAGIFHIKEASRLCAEREHVIPHQPLVRIRTLIDTERNVGQCLHQRGCLRNPLCLGRVCNVHAVGNQNQRINAAGRDRLQFIHLLRKRIRNMTRRNNGHRRTVGMRFCKLSTAINDGLRQKNALCHGQIENFRGLTRGENAAQPRRVIPVAHRTDSADIDRAVSAERGYHGDKSLRLCFVSHKNTSDIDQCFSLLIISHHIPAVKKFAKNLSHSQKKGK